jgi:proteic killer suppression protein
VIRSVVIADSAQKQLRKVPRHVAEKLADWALAFEAYGLEEIRKVPGYHDEPLKGKRAGQRSIRLSRAYRAIYVVSQGTLEFVSVEEVHKHDY